MLPGELNWYIYYDMSSGQRLWYKAFEQHYVRHVNTHIIIYDYY